MHLSEDHVNKKFHKWMILNRRLGIQQTETVKFDWWSSLTKLSLEKKIEVIQNSLDINKAHCTFSSLNAHVWSEREFGALHSFFLVEYGFHVY